MTKNAIDEDQVRAIAHAIWIEEGMPDGRSEAHWFIAVERVAAGAAKPAKTPRAAKSVTAKPAAAKPAIEKPAAAKKPATRSKATPALAAPETPVAVEPVTAAPEAAATKAPEAAAPKAPAKPRRTAKPKA